MGAATMVVLALAGGIGQAPLTIPQEAKGKVGEFVVIKAETPGDIVRWVLMDSGPSLLPSNLLRDSKTAVVFSLRPGKFRLLAYTAFKNEPSEPSVCVVTIGEGPDPGPGPGPGPGPNPPPPVDPLTVRLQDAYQSAREPVESKRKQLSALVGLYQAIAEHVDQDATLKTMGDVLGDLQRTAKAMIRADSLVECRKIIAAEIAASLGTGGSSPLDATTRAKARDTFARIASCLGKVTP